MTYFNNKNDNRYIDKRFMERIFNFPKLYRFKMHMVRRIFQLIQPWTIRNYFTFEEIINQLIAGGSSIFEIGCGDGKLYKHIRSNINDIKYMGSDINRNMIDYCRNQFPEATWQSYSSIPYPFPDNHFDFCIIENVLHHLDNYEEACNLLKEAMRIARYVVFLEPLQSDNRFLYFVKSLFWSITDGGKLYFTYSEFQNLFRTVGANLEWEKATEPLHQYYSCEISRYPMTAR